MPTQTGSYDFIAAKASHDSLQEQIDPIATKTYTGVNITANSDPAGWLYFGSVKPEAYNTPWRVRYVVRSRITTLADSSQYSIVTVNGCKDTYYAYQTYNAVSNTSYRPIYSHVVYFLTQAGFNAGYGHLLGLRFQSAYWGSTFSATAWPREIVVEVLEAEGCTVTLSDSMYLYANAPGTGTTNYRSNGRVAFDGITQGFTESGDRNEVNHLMSNFTGRTGTKGIRQYSLFMMDGDGTYQGICTHTDGNVNTNITVTSTKKANTNGFRVGSQVYYPNFTAAANANISASTYASYSLFDTRYSFNTKLVAGSLTAYQPVYLVGEVSDDDGLFYLDETWWTQTPDVEGKVYVLVGSCYDSTTSNCRMNLVEPNPWFVFDGDGLVAYDEYRASSMVAEEAASREEDVRSLNDAIEGIQEEARDAVTALRESIEGDAGLAAKIAAIVDDLASLQSFIKMDTSGTTPVMLLGSSESAVLVALTNSALEFRLKGSDSPFTYLAGDESGEGVLYVQNTVVVNDLRFGDGDWAWTRRENGNICLKFIEKQ